MIDLIKRPACSIWSSLLAFPIISPDEIERLTISDKFDPNALTFDNFDIIPHTAEETVQRFASYYREGAFSNAPFEPIVKDYTTKSIKA
jgi:hypothetical protein